MGSGKSTFARMLQGQGGGLVDADALAREVVDDDVDLRRELAAAFGHDLLDENDCLNRLELARRALADDTGRCRLEGIVRPRLEPMLATALATAETTSAIVVFDAPLIFEWRIEHWFDRIFVVGTEADTAASRVASSRGLDASEVHQRRAAQLHSSQYTGEIESVDNNGSLEELASKARKIWQALVRDLESA
jgi:dephospho-CoA kinase